MKTCKGCGIEFAPLNPRQKYHDKKCQWTSANKHKRESYATCEVTAYGIDPNRWLQREWRQTA